MISESRHELLGPMSPYDYSCLAQDERLQGFYQGVVEKLAAYAQSPEDSPIDTRYIPSMAVYMAEKGIKAKSDSEEEFLISGSEAFPHDFVEAVEKLNLSDVFVKVQGRIKNLKTDKYRLVPIVGKPYFGSRHDACDGYVLPHYAVQEGEEAGEQLYMDSSLAIGLAYKGLLRAVAGGYFDEDARTTNIVQLQGLIGSLSGSGERFKSGLYGGFDWRASLVNAWEALAGEFKSDSVSVISAVNNSWVSLYNVDNFLASYDKIADNMGYEFDPISGNWVKDLSQPFPK